MEFVPPMIKDPAFAPVRRYPSSVSVINKRIGRGASETARNRIWLLVVERENSRGSTVDCRQCGASLDQKKGRNEGRRSFDSNKTNFPRDLAIENGTKDLQTDATLPRPRSRDNEIRIKGSWATRGRRSAAWSRACRSSLSTRGSDRGTASQSRDACALSA